MVKNKMIKRGLLAMALLAGATEVLVMKPQAAKALSHESVKHENKMLKKQKKQQKKLNKQLKKQNQKLKKAQKKSDKNAKLMEENITLQTKHNDNALRSDTNETTRKWTKEHKVTTSQMKGTKHTAPAA